MVIFGFLQKKIYPVLNVHFGEKKIILKLLRDPGYRTRPVHAPFDEAFNKSNFKTKWSVPWINSLQKNDSIISH